MDVKEIVIRQRSYFHSGATLPVPYRKAALKKLKKCIEKNEGEIAKAIRADLGKSGFESYMCETGMVLSEISYMLKHIDQLSKEKRVMTPIAQFSSRSYQKPSPYGVVLIMSPWNYPFMLSIDPLVDAIAAGNTAIIKPSAYSPKTSELIAKIIRECFAEEYVAVVTGGRAENQALLNEHFDYIFFTGSQAVGKEVMRKAAEHLTPVTLELGGKSPCIVTKEANIRLAAKRIVFGKYLNLGQTCVAPDYIYVERSVKSAFIREVKHQIRKQYGRAPLHNPNYGKMVNEKHFNRVRSLIDQKKVIYGGEMSAEKQKIAPTVMDEVDFSDAIMQEEIFGPVMPILTFDSVEEVVEKLHSMASPLALYIFTENKEEADYVLSNCKFGGGCVNDTIIHLATTGMGFGGVGESGMGAYHGKKGFDTFTHYKSIVDKKTWIDLPMRYAPYRKIYDKLIHLFLR